MDTKETCMVGLWFVCILVVMSLVTFASDKRNQPTAAKADLCKCGIACECADQTNAK